MVVFCQAEQSVCRPEAARPPLPNPVSLSEFGGTCAEHEHDSSSPNRYHTATWRLTSISSPKSLTMVVVDPKIMARTERLLIRPLVMEDAEDIVLMRSDPEVMKHT